MIRCKEKESVQLFKLNHLIYKYYRENTIVFLTMYNLQLMLNILKNNLTYTTFYVGVLVLKTHFNQQQ